MSLSAKGLDYMCSVMDISWIVYSAVTIYTLPKHGFLIEPQFLMPIAILKYCHLKTFTECKETVEKSLIQCFPSRYSYKTRHRPTK